MARVQQFYITFDQKWAVYHPLETVTGVVSLSLGDRLQVDTVSARFFGLSRVFWVELEMRNNAFRNTSYYSEEIFFDEKRVLWRFGEPTADVRECKSDAKLSPLPAVEEGGDEQPALPKDSYAWPFSFQLPPDLPTSFDASHSPGYIRYSLKVSMMRDETIKRSCKAYFSVVKPVDMNLFAELKLPVCEKVSSLRTRSACFGPTASVVTFLEASLPKRGYVPGEAIAASIEFYNECKRPVKLLKVHLQQCVAAYVTDPEFKVRHSVHSVCTISHRPNGQQRRLRYRWNDVLLYVPAIVPTFTDVENIRVTYLLAIEAYFNSKTPSLCIHVPLVIGTVPLHSESAPTSASFDNSVALPPPYSEAGSSAAGCSYDHVPDLPPPTYEESVTGMAQVDDDRDANPPKYVFYNFSPPVTNRN